MIFFYRFQSKSIRMGEIVKTEDHLFSVKEEPLTETTNILIEIDEVLMQFLGSLEVGSLLSLSELLSLASRTECEHCDEVFYSSSLYQQHQEAHGETKPVISTEKDDMDHDEFDDKNDDKDWTPRSKIPRVSLDPEKKENMKAADIQTPDDNKEWSLSEEKVKIKL